MSRVWKKFFLKIGKAVGGVLSVFFIVFGSIFGLIYLGVDPDFAIMIGLSVTIFIPMAGFILYQVYKDCKDEVNDENKKIMRDIRGY